MKKKWPSQAISRHVQTTVQHRQLQSFVLHFLSCSFHSPLSVTTAVCMARYFVCAYSLTGCRWDRSTWYKRDVIDHWSINVLQRLTRLWMAWIDRVTRPTHSIPSQYGCEACRCRYLGWLGYALSPPSVSEFFVNSRTTVCFATIPSDRVLALTSASIGTYN